MAYWEKATKQAAQYSSFGTQAEHCSICEYYVVPNNCAKVDGKISSNGWCRFFAHKKERYSNKRGKPVRRII